MGGIFLAALVWPWPNQHQTNEQRHVRDILVCFFTSQPFVAAIARFINKSVMLCKEAIVARRRRWHLTNECQITSLQLKVRYTLSHYIVDQ